MDLGQLFAFIGQNPEFAPQLDAMGLPAPDMSMLMKLGGPGAGTPDPGALIPGQTGVTLPEGAIAPEGNPTMSQNPAVAGQAAPGNKNATALAALAGLKAFEPNKAPMSGGVTGTKAPEMTAIKAGVPSIQALLAAALGGGGAGGGVPNLGSLIRG